MIPYTMIFYTTRWTRGPQNLQRPIRTLIMLFGFLIKPMFRVLICFLLPVPGTLNEPTCGLLPVSTVTAGPITSDFHTLRLFPLESILNNHLRCIHKWLMAFSRVTSPIRMNNQAILTQSFDPMYHHLDVSGSWLTVVLNRWYDNTKKKKPLVVCLQLTCHC